MSDRETGTDAGTSTGTTVDQRTRREQILDAALDLFAESGSRGTSVAAVAQRVGITDAGVLYHFKTKKELLLGVLAHFEQRVDDRIVESGNRGIELLRMTREWGRTMERLPDLSSLWILLTAEHLTTPSPVRERIQRRYDRVLERYVTAFATAARAGDLRADLDPVHEAAALVAHMDGIRLQWFLLDQSFSMADSVRAYVDATLERLAP